MAEGFDDELPLGHPPVVPSIGSGVLAWAAPEAWTAQPPTHEMRLAQWLLEGATPSETGECALFHFPGGGTPEDNITRWVSQFNQSEEANDGSGQGATIERRILRVNGLSIHLVGISGTYITQDPPMTGPTVRLEDYTLVGAVIEARTPYFIKCIGPSAVIAAQAENIETFLNSLRFE